MMNGNDSIVARCTASWKSLVGVFIVALAAGAIAACGGDTGQSAAVVCSSHTECEFGEVCDDDGECVEGVKCQFCEEEIESGELICHEGICTAPACSTDDDCEDGERCIDDACQEAQECDNSEDCDDGYRCTLGGYCVEDENNGDNGENGDDDCTEDPDCTGENEVCSEEGECVDESEVNQSECVPEEVECTTEDASLVDPQTCDCVACLENTDCDGAQEQCVGGDCVPAGSEDCPSGIECDPNNPGTCGGDSPYCIEECCVECIGAGDCEGNELCVDGFCDESQGCTSDDDCPADYTCGDGGQCETTPDSGTSCSTDADCAGTQFCDPQTGTCQDLGGDMGCGFCNDDCTCDGGLSCDGFMCVGCDWMQGDCPGDQWCYPAADFDMASENFCGPPLM